MSWPSAWRPASTARSNRASRARAAAWRAGRSQRDRYPDHAFAADHTDLDADLMCQRREQGHQAIDWKVHVTDGFGLLQDIAETQRHRPQQARQARVFAVFDAGKQRV